MTSLLAAMLLLAAPDLSQLDSPPGDLGVVSTEGGALVFGPFTRYGPEDDEAALVRLMPDGTRDPAFGPFTCEGSVGAMTGTVWELEGTAWEGKEWQTTVTGLSPAPGGGVFVFGNFERCENKSSKPSIWDVPRGFALLNSQGQFLKGIASYCSTTQFLEAAPGRNGALLVGQLSGCAAIRDLPEYGDDAKLKPWFEKNLVWVDAAGDINAGAAAGTPGGFANVYAAKADPSGGIWIGGDRPGGGVVHLGASGALDEATTARAAAALPDQNDCTLAVGPNGSVATVCTHQKEQREYFFQKLDARGALDSAFSANAAKVKVTGGFVSAMAVQADGKVLVGGMLDRTPQFKTANLFRFNADGTIDQAFASNVQGALGAKEAVMAIAVQRDGKILIGGAFRGFKNSRAFNLVRLLPDGKVDTAYAVFLRNGFEYPVTSLLLTQDDKLLVGGMKGKLGTVPLRGFARFRDGVIDLDYTRRVTEYIRKLEDGAPGLPDIRFHQQVGNSVIIVVRPYYCQSQCVEEVCTETYLQLDDKGKVLSTKEKQEEIDCLN